MGERAPRNDTVRGTLRKASKVVDAPLRRTEEAVRKFLHLVGPVYLVLVALYLAGLRFPLVVFPLLFVAGLFAVALGRRAR